MKKNILKISLLSLTLIIISILFLFSFGKTYTLSFDINNDNYEFIVENYKGEVEILEEKIVNNKYIVKVKAVKPGNVLLGIKYGKVQNLKPLYIHKSMIITEDTYFGKFTYSEIIPISQLIILCYILYLLIKRYKCCVKENLYQYKNIAYLGIIIFLSFFILNTFYSIFNYRGLYHTVNNAINSMNYLSFILLPISFITFILVTISNIQLIIKEGKSLKNLLGLFLGIIICFVPLLPDYVYGILMRTQTFDIYNLNGPGPYIYNFIESLVYLSISYIDCILIGTIIIAIKSIKRKPNYNKDYVIILGCKIKKDGSLTPLLKGRVDKALEFRKKQLMQTNKDLIFIASGGKGKDEIISESEAIKKYLLENGIQEKNIIIENKSRNTFENIKFSYNLIKNKKTNICYATTNYHVLRAGIIATEQGLLMEGIGSKTKTYYWINAFIREFIGTIHREKKKHLIVLCLIVITISLMIFITYIANNV